MIELNNLLTIMIYFVMINSIFIRSRGLDSRSFPFNRVQYHFYSIFGCYAFGYFFCNGFFHKRLLFLLHIDYQRVNIYFISYFFPIFLRRKIAICTLWIYYVVRSISDREIPKSHNAFQRNNLQHITGNPVDHPVFLTNVHSDRLCFRVSHCWYLLWDFW